MRGIHVRFIVVVLVLSSQLTVVAQEFSERREIAVFRLSYYGQPVVEPPPGLKVEVRGRRGSVSVELRGSGDPRVDDLFIRAFGAVDERIRSVFTDLGRFDIIGMDQRLSQDNLSDFITVLSEFRQSQARLPEAVLLGQETFTEADFRALGSRFVVVVPSVSWYSLVTLDDGRYKSEIETSFSFIDVEDLTTFDQFFVYTSGVHEQRDQAVFEAVDSIPAELSFRVRSMPEFQIRTGILEVDGRNVTIEFGRNMGLKPGDEYAIVSTRVLSTGHIAQTETGLIVVSGVQPEFSTGTVLYASPRPMVGDQLQEVPRRGVELWGYLDVITNGLDTLTYAAGLRAIASRGFYELRPLAEVQVPFRSVPDLSLFPLSMAVGGEYNVVLGRLSFAPAGLVGIAGVIPFAQDETAESFYLSHVGTGLRVAVSVLVTRDIRLFIDFGLVKWLGIVDVEDPQLGQWFDSYGGLIVGGGIAFK